MLNLNLSIVVNFASLYGSWVIVPSSESQDDSYLESYISTIGVDFVSYAFENLVVFQVQFVYARFGI
jgi:hypothetical protein